MRTIQLLLITICLAVHVDAYGSGDGSRYDWMNRDLSDRGWGCIEPPHFTSTKGKTTTLNLDNKGVWVSSGISVEKDKLLKVNWSAGEVQSRPEKYTVLYRIDPRFAKPQIFIQRYDYKQQKYISNFHKAGLLKYQDSRTLNNNYTKRFADFNKFFNSQSITIKKNDVINVTLIGSGEYFSNDSQMRTLGYENEPLVIRTNSALTDNRMIYSNASPWCMGAIGEDSSQYTDLCLKYPGYYTDSAENIETLVGGIQNPSFARNLISIGKCPGSANGRNNTLCYYDNGRGMQFKLAGKTIKNTPEKFVASSSSSKDFFYYKSDVNGKLEFVTQWDIAGMYNEMYTQNGKPVAKNWSWQFMTQWPSFGNRSNFNSKLVDIRQNLSMNFLHFGRYFMRVEVGNSTASVSEADLNSINIEYTIMKNGAPGSSAKGTSIGRGFSGNASKTGSLWVRVAGKNDNVTGVLHARTTSYTGSTWFSEKIYGKLIKPLREKFARLTKTMYSKLVTDKNLQNIAMLMMVIYISIYGIMFLGGSVKITIKDIVTRIVKISLVVTLLFSSSSWEFFNSYLFDALVSGSDYLMSSVIESTSQSGNVFGFIDPIFDKYTDGSLWALLFIQLLQIHNGMTFFAIMTIYSILTYFRALIEVIVTYCLAFLGLAVLISIAPLFIILILFERTKSMFDNYISTMFSYMIQPTILLIFFLMIDQIMSTHIANTVVRSCWSTLIEIKLGLDLRHMGIPLSFSIGLPFLPNISFYVPQVTPIKTVSDFFIIGTISKVATSSLIFFALAKLSSGLVNYVLLIVQFLTNVLAARREGILQETKNPVTDIMKDMERIIFPARFVARNVRGFAKEKLIDQKIDSDNIRHRRGGDIDIDYSGMQKSNPDDPQNDSPDNNGGGGGGDGDNAGGSGGSRGSGGGRSGGGSGGGRSSGSDGGSSSGNDGDGGGSGGNSSARSASTSRPSSGGYDEHREYDESEFHASVEMTEFKSSTPAEPDDSKAASVSDDAPENARSRPGSDGALDNAPNDTPDDAPENSRAASAPEDAPENSTDSAPGDASENSPENPSGQVERRDSEALHSPEESKAPPSARDDAERRDVNESIEMTELAKKKRAPNDGSRGDGSRGDGSRGDGSQQGGDNSNE
ncbi:MAG: hypothetical protein COA94_04345 [Rickettsiales bacterium]|nr:MAG: hypothetical protein COA94_04345 [Rickettsiales bacterium]